MFLLLKIQSVLLSFFPPGGGGHFSQKLKTLKQSFWFKKKVAWHHSKPKNIKCFTLDPKHQISKL